MSWHWDREVIPTGILPVISITLPHNVDKTYYSWIYLLQPVRCTCCLGLSTIEAIFEFKQWLTDRIRERNPCRVNERDCADSPALKQ